MVEKISGNIKVQEETDLMQYVTVDRATGYLKLKLPDQSEKIYRIKVMDGHEEIRLGSTDVERLMLKTMLADEVAKLTNSKLFGQKERPKELDGCKICKGSMTYGGNLAKNVSLTDKEYQPIEDILNRYSALHLTTGNLDKKEIKISFKEDFATKGSNLDLDDDLDVSLPEIDTRIEKKMKSVDHNSVKEGNVNVDFKMKDDLNIVNKKEFDDEKSDTGLEQKFDTVIKKDG